MSSTRQRILRTAFAEFYRHGFQGGSLNRIVEETGLTKGALFHYFASKQDLGYGVVEEVIWPGIKERWIDPLEQSEDPIRDTKQLIRHMVETARTSLILSQGCPLNNLAQEMSPLDEEFRRRLEKVYEAWRLAVQGALTKGMKAGKVRKNVASETVAAFIVAALTGIIGTAKNAQDEQLLRKAGEGLLDYLDTLRP